MVIVSPLTGVVGPLANGLNDLKMVATNYLLSGMILQVSPENQWLEDDEFPFKMLPFIGGKIMLIFGGGNRVTGETTISHVRFGIIQLKQP